MGKEEFYETAIKHFNFYVDHECQICGRIYNDGIIYEQFRKVKIDVKKDEVVEELEHWYEPDIKHWKCPKHPDAKTVLLLTETIHGDPELK